MNQSLLSNRSAPADKPRYYFASQVTGEGKAVPFADASAIAHGEVYLNLVNRDLVRDVWHVRFVATKDGTKVKVEWESE